MATLTVGTSKQYSTIAAAVAAAHDGDVVAISAGTYTDDFATIRSKISVIAVGGTVKLVDSRLMASGQGMLTVTTDASVNGLVFSGAHSADGTASGLLVQGGAVVVQNSLFSGNQNGLVAGNAATATVTVTGSEFAANGNGDGLSHNISVGTIKSLTVQGSYIHDAVGGHEIKSLARATTITGSRIEDNLGAALNSIDVPNGGTVSITGNTIEKGARSSLATAIQFGGGTTSLGSTLNVSGNVFVADRAGGVMIRNQTMQAASVSSNQVYGFATQVSGTSVSSGNTVLASRPLISTAALIASASPAVPAFGREGAVVANGTVLTVGGGGDYATVAAAVAVAHDGDTINVAAGVYVNDTAVVDHKVIIAGVGGIAQFVDTTAPANGAQFVTTTDVTFRNIEVFGASSTAGVSAGIHDEGGNLTVVNSTIHNNQAGIVVDSAAGTSVGIYDTEIAANGTVDGRGGNVQVGDVGLLTLGNDYVHDAVAGPEITSAARSTVLDADRIAQSQANGSAVVALPNAGTVSITNSAIEKGATVIAATGAVSTGAVSTGAVASAAVASVPVTSASVTSAPVASIPVASAPVVSVPAASVPVASVPVASVTAATATVATATVATATGGAGPVAAAAVVQVGGAVAYADSKVTLAGNTLISDVATTKTVFVANSTPNVAVAVSGTTFVGGNSASTQVQNGTNTGVTVRSSGTVNTASPWGASGAPVAASLLAPVVPVGGAEMGQLILRVSETAWHGDAQFSLTVDGAAVAGTLTASALHGAGQSQTFTIAGLYAPGPHTVGVKFLNSLSGSDGGRALFVDGMTFNGQETGQSAALPANGTALLSTAPTTRSTAVTVNLSEDAFQGDAMAFISIDGKVQGGVQTVSASHAAGGTQAMSFLLNLAPGAHTAAVTLLNGISGGPGASRNLYVDSLDVAGAHYANAAASLGSSGSSSFAFTVQPAPAANGSLFVTAGAPTALSLLVPSS